MTWSRIFGPTPISLWSSFSDLCCFGGASFWPRLVLPVPRTTLGQSLRPTANPREHQHPLGHVYVKTQNAGSTQELWFSRIQIPLENLYFSQAHRGCWHYWPWWSRPKFWDHMSCLLIYVLGMAYYMEQFLYPWEFGRNIRNAALGNPSLKLKCTLKPQRHSVV